MYNKSKSFIQCLKWIFPKEVWNYTADGHNPLPGFSMRLTRCLLFCSWVWVPCRQDPVQCWKQPHVLSPAPAAQRLYPVNQPCPGAGQAVRWVICLPQHPQGGWCAALITVTSACVVSVLEQHRQPIIALLFLLQKHRNSFSVQHVCQRYYFFNYFTFCMAFECPSVLSFVELGLKMYYHCT